MGEERKTGQGRWDKPSGYADLRFQAVQTLLWKDEIEAILSKPGDLVWTKGNRL